MLWAYRHSNTQAYKFAKCRTPKYESTKMQYNNYKIPNTKMSKHQNTKEIIYRRPGICSTLSPPHDEYRKAYIYIVRTLMLAKVSLTYETCVIQNCVRGDPVHKEHTGKIPTGTRDHFTMRGILGVYIPGGKYETGASNHWENKRIDTSCFNEHTIKTFPWDMFGFDPRNMFFTGTGIFLKPRDILREDQRNLTTKHCTESTAPVRFRASR